MDDKEIDSVEMDSSYYKDNNVEIGNCFNETKNDFVDSVVDNEVVNMIVKDNELGGGFNKNVVRNNNTRLDVNLDKKRKAYKVQMKRIARVMFLKHMGPYRIKRRRVFTKVFIKNVGPYKRKRKRLTTKMFLRHLGPYRIKRKRKIFIKHLGPFRIKRRS